MPHGTDTGHGKLDRRIAAAEGRAQAAEHRAETAHQENARLEQENRDLLARHNALRAIAGRTRPRIFTAEQIDELPIGSVLAFIGDEPAAPAIACRAVRGWAFLGEDPDMRRTSASIASPKPLHLLHNPAWPEYTHPTQEPS